jgi:hypothetical protein
MLQESFSAMLLHAFFKFHNGAAWGIFGIFKKNQTVIVGLAIH